MNILLKDKQGMQIEEIPDFISEIEAAMEPPKSRKWFELEWQDTGEPF